jgi:hypothetical protein
VAAERLATRFIFLVNGIEWRSAPDEGSIYLPEELTLEYRDNESPSFDATVKDSTETAFFPIASSIPNPRCNEKIPVEAYIGWDGEVLVKAFAGLLTGKDASFPGPKLRFTSHHQAFKLRKREKVHTFTGLTVTQMIKAVAAQEGLNIIIDPSAANDEALTTPVSWDARTGTHWSFIYHWLHELGYTTQAIKDTDIIVRADKVTTGQSIQIVRGDDQLISVEWREQAKRAEKASKRRHNSTQMPPGQFAAFSLGVDCGNGRKRRLVRPSIGKKHPKEAHGAEYAHHSNRGIVRRLEQEGDALNLVIRLRPEMRNEEVITFSGYGELDDGQWETASVIHRLPIGHTEAACFRKH